MPIISEPTILSVSALANGVDRRNFPFGESIEVAFRTLVEKEERPGGLLPVDPKEDLCEVLLPLLVCRTCVVTGSWSVSSLALEPSYIYFRMGPPSWRAVHVVRDMVAQGVAAA